MSAADHVEKDFYGALGIPKTATPTEIKKAYRGLARELHPDKKPGDAAAEARFKEVSEAYDVLSDTTTKAEYDEARSLFGNGGFRRQPAGAGAGYGAGYGTGYGTQAGGTFDLGDLLNQQGGGGNLGDMFGGLFGGGGGRGRGPVRGDDLAAAVTVGLRSTLQPQEVNVRLPGGAPCDTCRGTGAAPGTAPHNCAVCGGSGMTTSNQGGFAFAAPCTACRGQGRVVDSPCAACGGTGSRERVQKIRVPAGVRDGQRLRVRGRGTAGGRGGPSGDLEVTVQVTPDPVFGRDGDALTITVPVTFPEAALGTVLRVPTLDGVVTVKVPAGTTSGRRLRVRDRGFPGAGGARGPLLVTVEVAVPQKLSGRGRELLEAYAAEQTADPREHLAHLTDPT